VAPDRRKGRGEATEGSDANMESVRRFHGQKEAWVAVMSQGGQGAFRQGRIESIIAVQVNDICSKAVSQAMNMLEQRTTFHPLHPTWLAEGFLRHSLRFP
jgi:hypothetical protein